MATNATVRIPFSASTQGQGIKVVATATPGTLVHTTGVGLYTSVFDQLYVYLYNAHTSDVLTTIEFGGATAPDQNIVLTVPFKQGLLLAVPGLILAGSGTVALTMKVFAATTNVIIVNGYVDRVTP